MHRRRITSSTPPIYSACPPFLGVKICMRIKKLVELTCQYCKQKHHNELKEYKRQKKNGQKKFYCNNSCSARDNPVLVEKALWNKNNPIAAAKRLRHFLTINGRGIKRPDNELVFSYYLRKINQRLKTIDKKKSQDRNIICNITIEYLKDLWNQQKSVCPYTKIEMVHPLMRGKACPYQASLDRIDSSKGYEIGNVEFVCLFVNYGKNGFSKEQTQDFFSQVKNSLTVTN